MAEDRCPEILLSLAKGACAGVIAACTQAVRSGHRTCIDKSQIENLANMVQSLNQANYHALLNTIRAYAVRQVARGEMSSRLAQALTNDIAWLLSLPSKVGRINECHIQSSLSYFKALKWVYEAAQKATCSRRNFCTHQVCRRLLQLSSETCQTQQLTAQAANTTLDTILKTITDAMLRCRYLTA